MGQSGVLCVGPFFQHWEINSTWGQALEWTVCWAWAIPIACWTGGWALCGRTILATLVNGPGEEAALPSTLALHSLCNSSPTCESDYLGSTLFSLPYPCLRSLFPFLLPSSNTNTNTFPSLAILSSPAPHMLKHCSSLRWLGTALCTSLWNRRGVMKESWAAEAIAEAIEWSRKEVPSRELGGNTALGRSLNIYARRHKTSHKYCFRT